MLGRDKVRHNDGRSEVHAHVASFAGTGWTSDQLWVGSSVGDVRGTRLSPRCFSWGAGSAPQGVTSRWLGLVG